MRVRIVNPLGPILVGRMLRVTGRLATALRHKLERATCRVAENILGVGSRAEIRYST